MILHTINKSPSQQQIYQHCIAHMESSDSLLLIEDGVYALSDPASIGILTHLSDENRLYALEPDIVARGLEDRSRIPFKTSH